MDPQPPPNSSFFSPLSPVRHSCVLQFRGNNHTFIDVIPLFHPNFAGNFDPTMSRGNQRDRDRERAQARAGGKGKQHRDDSLTPEQRRERDAKALQEKQARKAAQAGAAAGGNNTGGRGVKPKQ